MLQMSEVDISDLVTLHAGHSTVGFVDFERGTPKPYGSGTLISFGILKGILTCAHVADAIHKRREVGIVVFCRDGRRPQGLKVKVTECHSTILRGSDPMKGPDLAFILLPAATAEQLSAYATFTNGLNRRREAQESEPECDEAFAVVVGGVAEWTSTSETVERSITTMGALSNVGAFKTSPGADGYDFFEFFAHPERNFRMPKSYHGVSGGGLWKFYLKSARGGGFDVVQARLVGVAFYQTDAGTILCHGPRSVYHDLYGRLHSMSLAAAQST